MLILSYPYSNAAFVFVSPKENTECLRKPKALSYSSVPAFLPDKTKAFLLSSEGKQRKTCVDWLIRMLKTYNIDEIEKGLLHSELEKTEQLEHVFYKLRHPEFRPLPFLETRTPAILRGRKPDLSRYDRLQQWRAQKWKQHSKDCVNKCV